MSSHQISEMLNQHLAALGLRVSKCEHPISGQDSFNFSTYVLVRNILVQVKQSYMGILYMYKCIYRMKIYIYVSNILREQTNHCEYSHQGRVSQVCQLQQGLPGLGFAGFSGRTEECFTVELHLEPSVYTARVSLFSTHRSRTYPASFCPLLIPRVHLHTHLRSFTVCRTFTLGAVHYSGYDNYVTKI